MANGRSWHGDWHARIRERARRQGFGSLSAFADSRPLDSFSRLAEVLGPDDVNAAQVQTILRVEAEHTGTQGHFLRTGLVRRLRERFALGWAKERDADSFLSDLAGAISSWATGAEGLLDEDEVDRVWRFFRDSDIPTGWLPSGPDDPIIERAFAGVRVDAPGGEG